MSCRCCNSAQLNIKYILFLLGVGCLIFLFVKKITENKQENIKKEDVVKVI